MRGIRSRFILILSFIVLVLFSCKSKKVLLPPPVPYGCQEQNQFMQIEFSKSSCYGMCPEYIMRIFNNRKVEYIGTAYVKKIGKFQKTLSESEFKNVMSKFDSSFFEYKPLYNSELPDVPVTTTSYKSCTGKHKSIIDNYFPTNDLLILENYLDSLALNSPNWELITQNVSNKESEKKLYKLPDPIDRFKRYKK